MLEGNAVPERLSEDNPLLRTILDAFPTAVFIVDEELRVLDHNQAAAALRRGTEPLLLSEVCGEALGCLHHRQSEGGCGTTERCKTCVIREAAAKAFEGVRAVRRREVMLLGLEAEPIRASLLVTAAPFEFEGRTFGLLILEDLADVLQRGELLSICASCKKIRIDRDHWQALESYFMVRSGLEFSHGVCPSCYEELYGAGETESDPP